MRLHRMYTVPWIYTPFYEAQVPSECRQYTIVLDRCRLGPLCKFLGMGQDAGSEISEWLELGCQGIGAEEVMEISKLGVGFKPTSNVVLVLRVAAKKTDYCSE